MKHELLSPAGNFEKLKAAVLYGADAVYLAGRSFGMRSAADNFTVDELYEAVDYVHARGKKLYLTVNTMPHEDEYPALREFLSSLKGALMSRGPREISRLTEALGGNGVSVYGLCHLGDYEATVFSKFSHNRRFGEAFVKGEKFDKLAEGYYTVLALLKIGGKYGVDLPICRAVYDVVYGKSDAKTAIDVLFDRSLKYEF